MDLKTEKNTLESSDRVKQAKIVDTDILVKFTESLAYLDAVAFLDEALQDRDSVEHFTNLKDEDKEYDIRIEY